MKKFNSNNYSFFVLTGLGLDKINRGGTLSFSSYVDKNNALGKGHGVTVQYVVSKDDKGRDKGKFFTWNESHRKFQVRAGEKSINDISQYDYLKNYPDCEGSPNGNYRPDGTQIGVMFREMNTAKDAEVALEADKARIDAQASAIQLDTETLSEIAAHIGVFISDEDPKGTIMKVRVLDWAGKHPSQYNEVLNAGDRAIRALIRKAINDGVLTTHGDIIYWNSTMLGTDENSAITTVLSDKVMLSALKDKVKLIPKKK